MIHLYLDLDSKKKSLRICVILAKHLFFLTEPFSKKMFPSKILQRRAAVAGQAITTCQLAFAACLIFVDNGLQTFSDTRG